MAPKITLTEHLFPSTTWEYRKVKIKALAAPHGSASPQGTPSKPLVRRDRRSPLTLSIKYRGGPEAWYEIETRGRTYRFPGSTYLHDALECINEGVGGQERAVSRVGTVLPFKYQL
jgi:hypothetical protein